MRQAGNPGRWIPILVLGAPVLTVLTGGHRQLNKDHANGDELEFAHPPLPRGRHRLSPEEVAENQRRRLIAALVRSVAVRGYAGTTVDRILEGSGVSRGTFYQLFANRHECLLAAQEAVIEDFSEHLARSCRGEDRWERKVRAAVYATVGFAVQWPDQFRLLALDSLVADGESSHRGLAAIDRFAAMLRKGSERFPEAAGLPEATEQAMLGIVSMTISSRLLGGQSPAGLEPQLTYLVMVPYLGSAKARRLAAAAPQS